ncbi:MAG TPA: molybdenum cofactor guanylyltransferase [Actinomycetes bacterium]|nr:molybdenum cofactor guanylyltransferase [Actinomycetes bacterium]
MSLSSPPLSLTAVVLAGGSARRLDGIDKALIEVNGRTLLDHAIGAWRGLCPVVVVGPARPTSESDLVAWCREQPPGGGPLAGVAAALRVVTTDLVALCAVDQPLLGAAIAELIEAAQRAVSGGADGAWLQDSTGQAQPLASCVRRASLTAAMPFDPGDGSVKAVLASLNLALVTVPDDVLRDVDTADDLRRIRILMMPKESEVDESPRVTSHEGEAR